MPIPRRHRRRAQPAARPAAAAGNHRHRAAQAAHLAAVDALTAPIVHKLASRLLALTAVRLAALRGGRWPEIEDLDGQAPQWRIPPARMKLTKVRKADPAAEHIVPLSRQAVDVLKVLHLLTGGGELLFPGRRIGRPIGEGAIGDLYDAPAMPAGTSRMAGARASRRSSTAITPSCTATIACGRWSTRRWPTRRRARSKPRTTAPATSTSCATSSRRGPTSSSRLERDEALIGKLVRILPRSLPGSPATA
jgi:hypothetical protein